MVYHLLLVVVLSDCDLLPRAQPDLNATLCRNVIRSAIQWRGP